MSPSDYKNNKEETEAEMEMETKTEISINGNGKESINEHDKKNKNMNDPHSPSPNISKQHQSHQQYFISPSNDMNFEEEGSETMTSTINLFEYAPSQASMLIEGRDGSGGGNGNGITIIDESSLSYHSIQRQQSLLPRRWLRENVMNYEGNYITREPLLEELPLHHQMLSLSSSTNAAGGSADATGNNLQFPFSISKESTERMRERGMNGNGNGNNFSFISDRDGWAGILFKVVMISNLIIGFYCWMKSLSLDHLPLSRLYQALVVSSSKFFSLSMISILTSLIWLWLIGKFTTIAVYGMSLFIPIGGIVGSFWFVREFIHHPDNWILLIGGISTGMIGIWWSWNLFFLTDRIRNQRNIIEIFKITARVLDAKKGDIYLSSGMVLIGYILYLWIWIFLFERIVLFGNRGLMLYSLFVFIWGSSMASILQKFTISNIVCNWYFAVDNKYSSPVMFGNLLFTITRRFGTVSLASLILTFIRIWRIFIQSYRWISNVILPNWLIHGINSLTVISNFIDRLLEHLNDYAIYYSSFTGDDFCSSGRSAMKIFRRTMILGLSTSKLFYYFSLFYFNF